MKSERDLIGAAAMLTIRAQVLALHGSLILVIILISTTLFLLMGEMRHRWTQVMNETTPVLLTLHNLHASGETIFGAANRILLLEYLAIDANPKIRQELDERVLDLDHEMLELTESNALFNNSLQTYRTLVNRYFPNEKKLLQQISQSAQRLSYHAVQLLKSRGQLLDPKQLMLFDNQFENAHHDFVVALEAAMKHEQLELKERDTLLHSFIQQLSNQALMVSGIIILVTLLITLIIYRRLISPLSSLAGEMHKVADGNFDISVSKARHDEIGDLARAFSEMVTSRQRAEEALQRAVTRADQASQAKSDFLASMSHEIRTPMNIVIGMGDLLIHSKLDEEQQQAVEMIQKSGNALLEIINNILDIGRIEAGRLSLEKIAYQPQVLLVETLSYLALAAHNKGLKLDWQIEPTIPPWSMGDPVRIRQILINLVTNAIKFTDEGNISVRLELDDYGEAMVLAVEDSGVGIEAAHLEEIFHPFTQADSSIMRRFGGTGLGLTITRRLIDKMGGNIWVDSTVGEGSTFTCTLPCPVAPEPPPSIHSKADGVTYLAGTSLRILLVEDSIDNQLLIEKYLQDSDHQLSMAGDGQEAVERVKSEPFDLIIMDLQMPVMDGYSATRHIRQWELEQGRPAIPILACSAHALRDEMEKSIDAGCDVHLSKPIRKGVLLEAMERVIKSSPQD
uniref:histidine kinase n=1 Tax=Magnetococcus massalia (strain MO-1) TaxID=451514 RepID=A0A1S7LLX7_MAGMO|nr:Putative histidine kinase with response regulator receiver domain [Candidatus Magnetococcus massalia]